MALLWFRAMWGFPGGSDGKASACNAGDPSSIPGSGRSPGKGNGNPLQYSCLENPMDRGAWWATVHGVAKSRTRLSHFTSLHFNTDLLSCFILVVTFVPEKINEVYTGWWSLFLGKERTRKQVSIKCCCHAQFLGQILPHISENESYPGEGMLGCRGKEPVDSGGKGYAPLLHNH